MNALKTNSRPHHETADRPERAATWITEFERVFVAGAGGIRGEEMVARRRRKYQPSRPAQHI